MMDEDANQNIPGERALVPDPAFLALEGEIDLLREDLAELLAREHDLRHVVASKREPANAHDPLAIMVFSETGTHLGYVPRAKNEALARLMDAGKWLFAKLASKRWQGDWLLAEMQIYLRDE